MSSERGRLIEQYRLRQPVEELKRKADKAENRSTFTQERWDYARAWAKIVNARIKWRTGVAS
tara:strand:- start:1691 stop:1876 length:186 start_codon:yes stop_codon:yes gene_type:complete